MVHKAFDKQKISKNLNDVIPVVAATYVLNDDACAAPEGISELIEATNNCMPDGIKAAEKDINSYKLQRRRVFAQSVIGTCTASGVVVGAVPIPIADTLILSPLELAEVKGLAKIYGITKTEESMKFINSIIEIGTVSATAKLAISGIKAIPGLNLAGAVLNAVIAGIFVATIGEASCYLFEQIYLGNKTVEDIDWARKIVESKLTNGVIEKFKTVTENITENIDIKTIAKSIFKILKNEEKE